MALQGQASAHGQEQVSSTSIPSGRESPSTSLIANAPLAAHPPTSSPSHHVGARSSGHLDLASSNHDDADGPSPSSSLPPRPDSSTSSPDSPSPWSRSRLAHDALLHTPRDAHAAILEKTPVSDSTLRLRKTAAASSHRTDKTPQASTQETMFGSTPTASYLPLNSHRQVGPPTSSYLISWIAKHKTFVIFVLVALIVSVQVLLVGPAVMDMEPVRKLREEGLPSIKPPKWLQSPVESPDSWYPSTTNTTAPVVAPSQDNTTTPGVAPSTTTTTNTTAALAAPLLGPHSFPPPLSEISITGVAQSQDTLYTDFNPHRGELPTFLENLLTQDPVLNPPPWPQTAPVVPPQVWPTRLWADRSTTQASDAETPAKQTQEPEWRDAPWAGWTPPLDELAQPAKPLPKVQHAFDDPTRHSGRRNDPARDELIARRQTKVRNAFIHAWEGYKKHAWGHDELKPVSRTAQDPFNGWGASIVDALDTLLVMDLPREYDLARQHVRDIDFRVVGGTRSAYGGADGRIPVFETVIRYLGGLLSAYDLSGDVLMRDRAEELAQLILPAFDTRTGVPNGRIRMIELPDFPNVRPQQQGTVILSEAGSLLLEFTRLWQVTGNRTYFDRVQRITDWLDHNMTAAGRIETLFPTTIYPERNMAYGTISFGGMADSYYEYLIKQYQLLGGRLSQYGRMYSDAIEGAKKLLFSRVETVPGVSLMTVGEVAGNRYIAKLEHLACFSGGMLGLGSRVMAERADDLEYAKGIAGSCWWAYNSTTTGIGPENLVFYTNDDDDRYELINLPDGTKRRGKARGSPIVGVRSVASSYLNRPETIESVLYMWRITGDAEWQERGWQMFASWVTHCMTDVGFSAIYDVNRTPAGWADNMESFTFAETFKYYYLLFSPPELLSFDEYVFSTEAHPLLLPKDGKWGRAGHGSRKFWDADASVEAHLPPPNSGIYPGGELGPVGGLTNNQKQMLLAEWQTKNSANKIRDLINGFGGDALKNKLRSLMERGEPAAAASSSVDASQQDADEAASESKGPGQDARQDRLLASVAGTSVYEAADGTLEVEFAPNTDEETQQVVLEQLEAHFDKGIDSDSAALLLRSVEALLAMEEEEQRKAQEQAMNMARLRSKGIR